jgi:hypothetical protein
MSDFLGKISSYNIFNYLFPGSVFGVLGERAHVLDIGTRDILTRVIVYYFLGLCMSRVGSVVLEPFFKRSKFVEQASYASFLKASDKDSEMGVMVEVTNTYRTLTAGFLLLPLSLVMKAAADHFQLTENARYVTLSVSFLILFAFSYRRQVSFVRARVRHYASD